MADTLSRALETLVTQVGMVRMLASVAPQGNGEEVSARLKDVQTELQALRALTAPLPWCLPCPYEDSPLRTPDLPGG